MALRVRQEGLNSNAIYKHLCTTVSRDTIHYWIKSINRCGTIDLPNSKGRSRVLRTKALIQKVKQHLSTMKIACTRILAKEMKVSHTTMGQMIKEDPGLKPSIKRISPRFAEQHKIKRNSFGFWVRINTRKSMMEKILFADEKYFDIDDIYNRQNDRIYAATREEADNKGGIHRKTQHPAQTMVQLEGRYQGVTRPIIIDKGSIIVVRYIKEILHIALEDGTKLLDNDFIFQ